jgi:hypothetical protein
MSNRSRLRIDGPNPTILNYELAMFDLNSAQLIYGGGDVHFRGRGFGQSRQLAEPAAFGATFGTVRQRRLALSRYEVPMRTIGGHLIR